MIVFRPSFLTSSIAGVCLALASLPDTASAAAYWDINGATAGSGVVAAGTYIWSTGVANWTADSTGSSATNVWTNGDSAIFSAGTDATGQFNVTNGGVTVGDITQEEGRIRITNGTLTLAGSSTTINTQTRVSADYDIRIDSAIADSVAGPSSITKTGPGILMLETTNTYSGGFTLNGGTITIEGNGGVFGSGMLTLNSGNFTKSWGNGSTAVTVPNALNVTGAITADIVQGQPGNLIFSGNWSAGNTGAVFSVPNTAINGLAIQSSTIQISGDVSTYTGTFSQNTLAAGGNRLRFGAANAGSVIYDASNARFLLSGSTTGANCVDLADGSFGTFRMGELAGTGGVVRGGWTPAGNTTFEVGALNTDSKFGGFLLDNVNGAAGLTALNKVGSGTLELTLSSGNTYSAGTTVSQGALLAANSTGSATGTGAVTVNASGALGGTGRIAPGSANGVSISGTLAPGGTVSAVTGGAFTSSTGTLTIDLVNTTGVVNMLSGSGFKFELGAANGSLGNIATGSSDLLLLSNASTGDFTFNGNLVNFLGTGQQGFYKLFDTGSDASTWSGLTFDSQSGVVSSGLFAANLPVGLTGTFIVGTAGNGADSIGDIYVQIIPEPAAGLGFLSGVGVLALVRRRRSS